MSKTSLDFGFFCDVNQNLKARGFLANLLGTRSFRNLLSGFKRSWFVICDWWISIRFVCVRCSAFELQSSRVFEKRTKFSLLCALSVGRICALMFCCVMKTFHVLALKVFLLYY